MGKEASGKRGMWRDVGLAGERNFCCLCLRLAPSAQASEEPFLNTLVESHLNHYSTVRLGEIYIFTMVGLNAGALAERVHSLCGICRGSPFSSNNSQPNTHTNSNRLLLNKENTSLFFSLSTKKRSLKSAFEAASAFFSRPQKKNRGEQSLGFETLRPRKASLFEKWFASSTHCLLGQSLGKGHTVTPFQLSHKKNQFSLENAQSTNETHNCF